MGIGQLTIFKRKFSGEIIIHQFENWVLNNRLIQFIIDYMFFWPAHYKNDQLLFSYCWFVITFGRHKKTIKSGWIAEILDWRFGLSFLIHTHLVVTSPIRCLIYCTVLLRTLLYSCSVLYSFCYTALAAFICVFLPFISVSLTPCSFIFCPFLFCFGCLFIFYATERDKSS